VIQGERGNFLFARVICDKLHKQSFAHQTMVLAAVCALARFILSESQ